MYSWFHQAGTDFELQILSQDSDAGRRNGMAGGSNVEIVGEKKIALKQLAHLLQERQIPSAELAGS